MGIFLEGEDSRGDHGLGRLVEFRFKAPPGTISSSITTHIPSGQRHCASRASQHQKSVTFLPCPGERTTKSTKRTCGGIGRKKKTSTLRNSNTNANWENIERNTNTLIYRNRDNFSVATHKIMHCCYHKITKYVLDIEPEHNYVSNKCYIMYQLRLMFAGPCIIVIVEG